MYASKKQAFALCTVPGTQFNLSYESLTSRGARQAILELRTTDPDFYTEITSGRHSRPPTWVNDIDNLDESDFLEGDVDHSVDRIASAVLNARTAAEAVHALQVQEEADFEEEDSSAPLLPTPMRAAPSGKALRISSRYCNIDWV